MLERLKTALVDSYVGAIALGFMFSQGISQFVRTLINPVTVWVQQREYSQIYQAGGARAGFPFQSVLPQLLMSVFELLIAFGLLRWLYYPRTEKQDQEPAPEPEQGA